MNWIRFKFFLSKWPYLNIQSIQSWCDRDCGWSWASSWLLVSSRVSATWLGRNEAQFNQKTRFFLLRKVRTALHFCRRASSSGFYEFRCTAVVAEVEVVGFASTLADDVCCYWNGEIKQTWSKWRSQCPPMTLGYCVKVEPNLGCVTLSHFCVWFFLDSKIRRLRLYVLVFTGNWFLKKTHHSKKFPIMKKIQYLYANWRHFFWT